MSGSKGQGSSDFDEERGAVAWDRASGRGAALPAGRQLHAHIPTCTLSTVVWSQVHGVTSGSHSQQFGDSIAKSGSMLPTAK